MSHTNPLIQAPHVPKRVIPEWEQFVEGGAAGPTRNGQPGSKSSVWSQAGRSDPYASSNSTQPTRQKGPLRPAWLQQQPEAQSEQTAQGVPAHGQHKLQLAPNAVTQPATLQHPSSTAHSRPAASRAAGASAERGLGSFRATLEGSAEAPCLDDSDDLLAVLDSSSAAQHHAGMQAQSVQQRTQQQQQQPQWGQHAQQGPQHLAPTTQQRPAPGLTHYPWQQPAAQGRTRQTHHQQQPQQQQANRVKRPVPAFDIDSDDDVQLPDSWMNSSWAAAAAAGGSAGAAAGVGAAGRPVGSSTVGALDATAKLRMPAAMGQQHHLQHQQQWQHAPQGQHWQQTAPGPPANLQQQHQQPWQPQVANMQQEASMRHQEGVGLSHQHHMQQHQVTQGPGLSDGGWQDAAYQFSGAHPGQQQANHAKHQQPAQLQQQQAQHGRQQQGNQGVPQQQQRRTAAASLWSGGVNLSGLSRVPAAGTAAQQTAAAAGSAPAATGGAGGQQQGGKAARGAAAQKDSCLAAAAAAAGMTQAGPVQPKKGGKAAGRGSKGGNSKRAGKGSSSSGVSMEFVPRGPGDASQQPKLHQTTLKDTLKRAERNKQREQPQEGGSSEQQGDMQGEQIAGVNEQGGGNEPGGATAAKQPAASKRKRAAVAAAGAGSGGASGGASGGGRSGGDSGAARGKKVPRLSKTAAALEAAVEALDTWSLSSSTAVMQQQQQQQSSVIILDTTLPGTAVWQQLQRELASAEGVALGVLYSKTVLAAQPAGAGAAAPLAVQYFSSLQPPYKQQRSLLSKAASYVKKQAATSAAAVAATGAEAGEDSAQDPADTAGVQQVMGLAVMPVARGSASSAAAAGSRPAAAASASYFVRLQQQQGLPAHVQQLLQAVLCDPGKRPCVCCSAKAVLCSLADQGLQVQAASSASVIDPELLGWLLDPQLIQDTKNEACYTLEQQLSRNGMKVLGVESLGPLQRLHQHLCSSLDLAARLYGQLSRGIAESAIKLEMQVAVLLAKMEVAGVACAPSVLSDHRPALAGRLGAIKTRAAQLVGYNFNLSSSQQLAKVLYEDLRLTPPAGGGGRGAAKTHLPTNEAALKQLAITHELPGLVLEYRCIVNVMSKWIDAPWVQQAAQRPAARVHCTWQQTSTATGRLSSCAPNLQAVTKYTISAQDTAEGAAAAAVGPDSSPMLTINVRDAFVAPAGKLLLSADYSQIELRLLAHFSEDQLLRQILSRSTGDVFNMIAAALQQHARGGHDSWLSAPGTADAGVPQVSPEEREQAKRVVYGIVYGQTPWGLAQQLADQGVRTAAAQGMIDSFLARFQGVRHFMQRSIAAARSTGAVSTLMGRRRPIPGLTGDFQDRSAAERKVVNSQIQGSAADLIKLAMCAWDEWAAAQQRQQQPPQQMPAASSSSTALGCRARLIAQIHDELLFEIDAPDAVLGPAGDLQHPGQHFMQVSAAVKQIMESAAPMTVPLRVKLAWGYSWGSLNSLDL